MRPLFILVMAGLFLVACSSTEWVNVNNPKADYASDYRKCEEEGYSNPKFQGGMKMILQEHIDRCLKKQGWRLRQKRD
jgi:hypothetical protein